MCTLEVRKKWNMLVASNPFVPCLCLSLYPSRIHIFGIHFAKKIICVYNIVLLRVYCDIVCNCVSIHLSVCMFGMKIDVLRWVFETNFKHLYCSFVHTTALGTINAHTHRQVIDEANEEEKWNACVHRNNKPHSQTKTFGIYISYMYNNNLSLSILFCTYNNEKFMLVFHHHNQTPLIYMLKNGKIWWMRNGAVRCISNNNNNAVYYLYTYIIR